MTHKTFRTTDNNISSPLQVSQKPDIANLEKIANKTLSEISLNANSHLLVFPPSWQQGLNKKEATQVIFTLSKKDELATLKTGNVMGFLGITDKGGHTTELNITSRFENHSTDTTDDSNNGKDFFLHYMLLKVFNLNIVNLDLSGSKNGYYDLLKYMFPSLLQNALSQGLYKEYQNKKYNDANVKGTVDVQRHIRFNIPFNGKVAYNTREFSYDNKVTELVRHTIEFLQSTKSGKSILTSSDEIKLNVSRIISATPSYKKADIQKVLRYNVVPLTHPFFVKYRDLQILCKMILMQNYSSFTASKNQIHGILFDGAWLWEEYMAKVFAENKTGIEHKTTRDQLFIKDDVGQNQGIIPDFIKYTKDSSGHHTNATFIGDTKYKHIDTNGSYNREDYFQVLSYMFRYSSKIGCLIFPYDKDAGCSDESSLVTSSGRDEKGACYKRERVVANQFGNGLEKSTLFVLGMKIPQDSVSFEDFCKSCKSNEQKIMEEIFASEKSC